jgi:MFS family permease
VNHHDLVVSCISEHILEGGGVIADMYKLTERGTAMGVFLAAALLGNALAPIVGGWAAHYSSWRYLHLALAVFGGVLWFLMLLYLPETSHPGATGLEKLAKAERNSTRDSQETDASDEHERPSFRWVWLNPLSSLWVLRSPNLALVVSLDFFPSPPDSSVLTAFQTFSAAAVLVTEFGRQFELSHLSDIVKTPLLRPASTYGPDSRASPLQTSELCPQIVPRASDTE